jgi:hypothetical protein
MFLYLASVRLPGEEYSLNDTDFGIGQFYLLFVFFHFLPHCLICPWSLFVFSRYLYFNLFRGFL